MKCKIHHLFGKHAGRQPMGDQPQWPNEPKPHRCCQDMRRAILDQDHLWDI